MCTSFLSLHNKLFVLTIVRYLDLMMTFSRKLILEYINEEMRFILLLLKIILHFRFPRTFLNYKKPCGRNMWEKLPKDSSSECSSRCSSEIKS